MAWLASANGELASGDSWTVTDAHYRKDSIFWPSNSDSEGNEAQTRFVETWKKYRVETKQTGVYDYESANAIANAVAEDHENSQVQVTRANDAGGYRVTMTTETVVDSGENDPLDNGSGTGSGTVPGSNTGGTVPGSDTSGGTLGT